MNELLEKLRKRREDVDTKGDHWSSDQAEVPDSAAQSPGAASSEPGRLDADRVLRFVDAHGAKLGPDEDGARQVKEVKEAMIRKGQMNVDFQAAISRRRATVDTLGQAFESAPEQRRPSVEAGGGGGPPAPGPLPDDAQAKVQDIIHKFSPMARGDTPLSETMSPAQKDEVQQQTAAGVRLAAVLAKEDDGADGKAALDAVPTPLRQEGEAGADELLTSDGAAVPAPEEADTSDAAAAAPAEQAARAPAARTGDAPAAAAADQDDDEEGDEDEEEGLEEVMHAQPRGSRGVTSSAATAPPRPIEILKRKNNRIMWYVELDNPVDATEVYESPPFTYGGTQMMLKLNAKSESQPNGCALSLVALEPGAAKLQVMLFAGKGWKKGHFKPWAFEERREDFDLQLHGRHCVLCGCVFAAA